VISKARADGAVALFDLGDNLTARLPVADADRQRQELRSDLILGAMGKLAYDGFVPGERDLALGLERLRTASREQKLKLLSANLTPVAGDNPFVGHVEVKAGELMVCAVAVQGSAEPPKGGLGPMAPFSDYGPEVQRTDPAEAAKRELAALQGRPCDVKILLAHMDRAELDKLLVAVPGFDAAIVGHQGQQFPPQRSNEVAVFGDGARGRQVGEIHLGIADQPSTSPFVDKGEGERLKENEAQIQKQIDDLKKRIKTVPEAAKAQAEKSLDSLEGRLKDVRSKLPAAEHKRDPRVYAFEWINLGTDIADEPALKTEVDDFEKVHPEPPPPALPPRPMPFRPAGDGGAVPPPGRLNVPPPGRLDLRPMAPDGGAKH
jgi:2',3'-cyclic-nucleotide 2'-phosphodiesterase (5'-nucleotidase family)